MGLNSALCLRFDDLLDPHSSGSANFSSMISWLIQAVEPDLRLQFFLNAKNVLQTSDLLNQAAKAGHGMDIGLNLAGLNNIAALESHLAASENAFKQARLSWWGVGYLNNTPFMLDKESLSLALMDRGYRWVSTLLTKPEKIANPQILLPDLYELPAMPIWLNRYEAGLDGLPTSAQICQQVFFWMDTAAQKDLILTLAIPSSWLASLENWHELMINIFKYAHRLQLPLITLNEIADITLAHYQAEGPARERVSVQQHLQFKHYWDTIIGPGQQAYKVYDYRGGWRLKPGCYRRSANGWEILNNPDRESGYQINQHGLRGPMYPHRKPEGEIRILILGDSCVFGVAGDEAPWPAQVQRRLDELAGAGEVRILNGGIEGQSSIHCLMRLERLLTFEPDILLLAVAANDLFIEDPATYVDTTDQAYATTWEVVGEYPRERDITKTAGGEHRPITLDDFFPYSYVYHLRKIVLRCQQKGAIPVLMTLPCLLPADLSLVGDGHQIKMHQPTFVQAGDFASMRRLYEVYNRAIRLVARETKSVLIEGEEFIARNFDNQRDILFSDTCHPTAKGNQFLGRFTADCLWDAFTGILNKSNGKPF